jgi:hypothetical protein
MAQQRACITGLDTVIATWETMNNGLPYFAVWYNKADKYFQFNGDDLEKAKEFLIDNLQAIADTGDNSQYYLKVYPQTEINYKRSGEVCSICFRLNVYNEGSMSQQIGAYTGGNTQNLNEFARMLKESNDKHLAAMQEIVELKSMGGSVDWFDRIGGLLETPGNAQMVGSILSPVVSALVGILTKISGQQSSAVQQQPAMMANHYNPVIAGPQDNIDLDEQLDLQLDRLQKHGDLLEMLTALANFADNSPAMFKGYFDMLKSQQK